MEFIENVFIYGNSKKDQLINNGFEYVDYIGRSETIDKFDMINIGGYPAIVPNDSGYRVQGDLYTIKESQLKDLDQLKGDGIFFDRILSEIYLIKNNPRKSGNVVSAWIYVLKDMPKIYDESNIFLTTKNLLTYERI
tara:strand:- start:1425 stop:1835 length:411 start_codon:yes stop_codon:yes gene_type:complete